MEQVHLSLLQMDRGRDRTGRTEKKSERTNERERFETKVDKTINLSAPFITADARANCAPREMTGSYDL